MQLTCAREQMRAPDVNICLMVILDGKARRLYYRVMFPGMGHTKSVQQHKPTRFCNSRQIAQLYFNTDITLNPGFLGLANLTMSS